MIDQVDPRTYPARPPSEVEWEDLLVRLEITPRALRIAVEDAPGDAAVVDALEASISDEVRIQEELDAIVAGEEGPQSVVVRLPDSAPQALLAQFARMRARTFAMVQRRGLDVWDWTTRGGIFGGATAYQLLQAAAARDAATLAVIHRAGRGEAGG